MQSTQASNHTERLRFIRFYSSDSDALRRLLPAVEASVDRLLEGFYSHISSYPELLAKFQGPRGIAHAKDAQKRHWLHMFAGRLDEEYVTRVQKIGQAHERIGLEPRWYIASYSMALAELMRIAYEAAKGDAKVFQESSAAVIKAVLLDMDYAISVYIGTAKDNYTARLEQLANNFQDSVLGVVDQLSDASAKMTSSASGMASAASQTISQVDVVSQAAVDTSSDVVTVASAVEELTASVKEINRQVSHSTQITQSAVDRSESTNSTIAALAEAGNMIGRVVKMISKIASQTHLLALNATIEASRAGDAGKGFAVVASEVKLLASQTASATEGIANQVAAIQEATLHAVEGLKSVSKTIEEMNDISGTIANAVREQDYAIQEISRSAQKAASQTSQMTSGIQVVTLAAGKSEENAESVLDLANELASQSEELRRTLTDFIGELKTRD